MIHPLSDVKSSNIGDNTFIWQYSIVLENAVVGSNCNINCHVFIENEVIIGNDVTIKSGVYLWDGLSIEHNVFIGPNVTFTNDSTPRSKLYPDQFQRTILKRYSSIGAASTILGGVVVGEFAIIGAGSLITKNVPARALVYGNPARIMGWLNPDGSKMKQQGEYFVDNTGELWEVSNNEIIKIDENSIS